MVYDIKYKCFVGRRGFLAGAGSKHSGRAPGCFLSSHWWPQLMATRGKGFRLNWIQAVVDAAWLLPGLPLTGCIWVTCGIASF